MIPKSAIQYIADVERRHNLSAEKRSLGQHGSLIPGHPLHPASAHDVAPGENCCIKEGTSGMEGKAGRGDGQKAKSNFAP